MSLKSKKNQLQRQLRVSDATILILFAIFMWEIHHCIYPGSRKRAEKESVDTKQSKSNFYFRLSLNETSSNNKLMGFIERILFSEAQKIFCRKKERNLYFFTEREKLWNLSRNAIKNWHKNAIREFKFYSPHQKKMKKLNLRVQNR